jgi:UDP-N-acetylglucosamine--N-acetylmuramyl-(pentapeptide) pyrophosphoryl-undecaprenol N-acetylglucosamine transferase
MMPGGDAYKALIAGGGTGGHLFPGIAVAEELSARVGQAEVHFVVGRGKMDVQILPRYGYPVERLDIEGLKGRGLKKGGRVITKLPKSFFQAWSILREWKPKVVLGMGAYSAGPICLAAKMMGIPTAIHEQNSYPGLTNRMLARYVDRVFISFEESRKHLASKQVVLTGTPIRPEMVPDSHKSKSTQEPFTVLVVGGSQGARAINDAFVEALAFLRSQGKHPRVIHQTGGEDHSHMMKLYREKNLTGEVLPFIHQMAEAYLRSNLVIGRAGASTIFELASLGRQAILIPYPFAANRHQDTNARTLVQRGAAEMISQDQLTGERLGRIIMGYMEDPSALQRMGEKAKGFGRRDAARVIVDQLLEMARADP